MPVSGVPERTGGPAAGAADPRQDPAGGESQHRPRPDLLSLRPGALRRDQLPQLRDGEPRPAAGDGGAAAAVRLPAVRHQTLR